MHVFSQYRIVHSKVDVFNSYTKDNVLHLRKSYRKTADVLHVLLYPLSTCDCGSLCLDVSVQES